MKAARRASELERNRRALSERRYSPSLKVFIYTPHENKLAHLFAVTSTGARFGLCGRAIDDTVGARQVTQLPGRMCLGCQREAKEILSRKILMSPLRALETNSQVASANP